MQNVLEVFNSHAAKYMKTERWEQKKGKEFGIHPEAFSFL